MQKDIDTAALACEQRNLQLLSTVVPKIINSSTVIPLFDKNGIKIVKPSLLHICCFHGGYDCVKYLIENHVDINAVDTVLFCFRWFSFVL